MKRRNFIKTLGIGGGMLVAPWNILSSPTYDVDFDLIRAGLGSDRLVDERGYPLREPHQEHAKLLYQMLRDEEFFVGRFELPTGMSRFGKRMNAKSRLIRGQLDMTKSSDREIVEVTQVMAEHLKLEMKDLKEWVIDHPILGRNTVGDLYLYAIVPTIGVHDPDTFEPLQRFIIRYAKQVTSKNETVKLYNYHQHPSCLWDKKDILKGLSPNHPVVYYDMTYSSRLKRAFKNT